MTRDDIIRLALEAGFEKNSLGWTYTQGYLGEHLERFAALVAAHERNRKWTQAHWTEYERSIAAAERELAVRKCVEVCEAHPTWTGLMVGNQIKYLLQEVTEKKP